MTSFQFDYSKGAAVELCDCPRVRDSLGVTDHLLWVLLNTTGLQADATLNNHQTLAALLAAGNTECAATNYARKVLNRGDITIATNTSTGVRSLSAVTDPVIWTSLGGAVNNTMAKMLLCYWGSTSDADTLVRPLYSIDASGITTGQDFKVDLPATFGSAG